MEVTLLVKSIAGLVVILGILIFILLYMQSIKKAKAKKKLQKKSDKAVPVPVANSTDLHDLLAVVRNKKSTTKELSEALNSIIKYHGKIHPKLGVRTHPDFDIYAEILLRICRHPHTSKDLIIKFDRELEKRNPEYVREINDSLTKGLNSRGF